jgi:hypothetical protein
MREHARVRALTGPVVNRSLVCRILGAADLRGRSAVCWVALLYSQFGEHGLCGLVGDVALRAIRSRVQVSQYRRRRL